MLIWYLDEVDLVKFLYLPAQYINVLIWYLDEVDLVKFLYLPASKKGSNLDVMPKMYCTHYVCLLGDKQTSESEEAIKDPKLTRTISFTCF